MNILKVLPDLSKSKHLGLFHRAAADVALAAG